MARLNSIEALMDPRQGIMALCDGNPGALNAMISMVKEAEETDPDSAFGRVSPLISLDELGIYGSDIWVLFKDVCGQDVTRTLAVLRANQLGILSTKEVKGALTQGGSEEKTALRERAAGIVAEVKERLPNFATNTDQ